MLEKSFPTLTDEQRDSGLSLYVGTKGIAASPGKHEKTGEPGWIVIYPDGYQSFSPDHAFEAYHPVELMPFEAAFWAMKRGAKVRRPTQKNPPEFFITRSEHGSQVSRYFDGNLTQAVFTQADMLATDWQIVEV